MTLGYQSPKDRSTESVGDFQVKEMGCMNRFGRTSEPRQDWARLGGHKQLKERRGVKDDQWRPLSS